MRLQHRIVFAETDTFAGWPANNGVWRWESEILAGFTTGPYVVGSGHNIGFPQENRLARSVDGGITWRVETPANYAGSETALRVVTSPLHFTHPDFALRVTGDGYHGNTEKRGGFFYSYDRGQTWQGPFHFAGLAGLPQLDGAEMTPRTDYLVEGPDTCLVFLSARAGNRWGADRTFCARTNDGGLSFQFIAWIVGPEDPYRAVMPSTVRCSQDKIGLRRAQASRLPISLVTALRRRDMRETNGECWLDAYVSHDAGAQWAFLSRIGETGAHNGNPPALAALQDGRLCCVYGQRDTRRLLARYSEDEGASWSAAYVLRDDYASVQDDQDFGYPRLVQRPDGCLVALYYWATREHPHQHIAATIWNCPA